MYIIKLYFKDKILYHSYDGEPDELSEAMKFTKEDASIVSKFVKNDLENNNYYKDTFIKTEIIGQNQINNEKDKIKEYT